jgi:hypothetical protein
MALYRSLQQQLLQLQCIVNRNRSCTTQVVSHIQATLCGNVRCMSTPGYRNHHPGTSTRDSTHALRAVEQGTGAQKAQALLDRHQRYRPSWRNTSQQDDVMSFDTRVGHFVQQLCGTGPRPTVFKRRLIGLDVSSSAVGVAVTEGTNTFASPETTIWRRKPCGRRGNAGVANHLVYKGMY